MARFTIIENGVVINVARADSALAENWIASDTAQKGFTWNGSEFTPGQLEAPARPPDASVIIGRVINMLASKGVITTQEADSVKS